MKDNMLENVETLEEYEEGYKDDYGLGGGWNYRVIRNIEHIVIGELKEDMVYYAIHEVFYDKFGNPTCLTETPVFPQGETQEELMDAMIAYSEAMSKPVLNFEDF